MASGGSARRAARSRWRMVRFIARHSGVDCRSAAPTRGDSGQKSCDDCNVVFTRRYRPADGPGMSGVHRCVRRLSAVCHVGNLLTSSWRFSSLRDLDYLLIRSPSFFTYLVASTCGLSYRLDRHLHPVVISTLSSSLQ